MTRRLVILLTLIVFITILNAQTSQKAPFVEDHILIQLKYGGDIRTISQKSDTLGITSIDTISNRLRIYLLHHEKSFDIQAKMMDQLRNLKEIAHVQYDHRITSRNIETNCWPEDPFFSTQWSLLNTGQSSGRPGADIKATDVWDHTSGGLTATGDTIIIAIIDGGSDLNHEDVNFWKNSHEIPNNSIDDDNNGWVDDYNGWNAYSHNDNIPLYNHGIHVTGIAAAKGNNGIGITGVNWGIKVMPVAGSSTTESTVVEALSYVFTQRESYNQSGGTEGAFVVADNCSFGVDGGDPADYPIWEAMYDSLGKIGVLSIGATANLNWNIDETGDIPTSFTTPYLISVTNTTRLDEKYSIAGYGQQSIDLGAPGTLIMSCRTNNTYGTSTGTSMAAPHVTGAVALLYAGADTSFMLNYWNNPESGSLLIKEAILSGVDLIPGMDTLTVSGGRLNIFKALRQLYNGPVMHLKDCEITDTLPVHSTKVVSTTIFNTGGQDLVCTLSIPGQPSWISIPTSLTPVPEGDSLSFEIVLTSDNLVPGTYSCDLNLEGESIRSRLIPVILEVDSGVGINDKQYVKLIRFLPNPFHQRLTLEFDNQLNGTYQLIIMNCQGEIILEDNNSFEGQYQQYNTANWPSGLYLYRLTTDEGFATTGKLIHH